MKSKMREMLPIVSVNNGVEFQILVSFTINNFQFVRFEKEFFLYMKLD